MKRDSPIFWWTCSKGTRFPLLGMFTLYCDFPLYAPEQEAREWVQSLPADDLHAIRLLLPFGSRLQQLCGLREILDIGAKETER